MFVAGLGNPGDRYAAHRHNVGFMALEVLNASLGLVPEHRSEGVCARGVCAGEPVMTLKPSTFMNASGQAVQSLARWYRIPVEQLWVIHDDLDLPLGEVRIKRGGSDGGHNGLRSITACIGADYARIRLGIGRPAREEGGEKTVTSWVLGPFSREERTILDPLLDRLARHWPLLLTSPFPAHPFREAVRTPESAA
jgi:PTH1 family peptidyl-tRNA hydrolase